MMYGPLQYTPLRDIDRAVGQKLSDLRTTHRLSEVALANFLQIPLLEYLAYEVGHQRVSAAHLHKLAQLFGNRVHYFLPAKPQSKARARL